MLSQVKEDIEEMEKQRQGLTEDFRVEKTHLANTDKKIRHMTEVLRVVEEQNGHDQVSVEKWII